jgi:hypothetical protein
MGVRAPRPPSLPGHDLRCGIAVLEMIGQRLVGPRLEHYQWLRLASMTSLSLLTFVYRWRRDRGLHRAKR